MDYHKAQFFRVFCTACTPATSRKRAQGYSCMPMTSQQRSKPRLLRTQKNHTEPIQSSCRDILLKETVSCVFHLNNREANRRLRIKFNGKRIKHDKNLKYLGVILDRSLTYRPHLKNAQKKLKSRVNIVQKLAGSSWGCSAKTLKITTQSLIMSIADYCSPVWMNSCHVKLVDTRINIALRLISGSVQSTELEWLNVLSNIAPAHICKT